MSFDINWNNLSNDSELNNSIFQSLNNFLNSITLPSYVKNLKLEKFSLGSTAPDIKIKQITEPLVDFYDDIQNELSDDQVIEKSPNDVQILTEVEYKGDLSFTLSAELVLNYPSAEFMTLPVKITVGNLGFHSLCILAYLSKQAFFSFLCDINDSHLVEESMVNEPNGFNISANRRLERIFIIRSLSIETEAGEQNQKEGSILKNIGKLELFLSDKLKEYLTRELAWPSWINLDFNDEETDVFSKEED
ncbi:hypothetical protein TPHA_0F02440 [Tetrapisispora phaffii CBS 4417]|uniref:Mitochondrial distribution and morphology protein 12 n=1 Tax=Tetrapisispora phaffii (strain ATCC 24235 / CBS 4417 / NBRC 1672 / NRRL Y-8282 / UCD 70-5) TaxID=1071381 RepID=G8BUD9_TETPH|nr:hypothetical protein TPHA_0F02440 [Tetrapisispora phaffii CBS 4417]CCE63725.1 hypothetical protein TPHA_0F02440 [Tetrapisispora phaffii CBS 4417]